MKRIAAISEKSSPTLILASASQRRRELLASIGYTNFTIAPADIDETPRPQELPKDYVLRVAQEKALNVWEERGKAGITVLAADTIVAMGRRIYRKAQDIGEARAQITQFSGRRHRGYTGLCVITKDASGKLIQRTRAACTFVAVKHLHPREIEAFLETREWEGVACYQILGYFGSFVRHIRGQPSTILGLPVFDTYQMLQGLGVFP
jgi:septum formation protein